MYDTLFKSELELDNFKKSNQIDSNSVEPLPSVYSRINDFSDQIVAIELEENVLLEIEKNIRDKDVDIYKLIAIISGSEFEGSISTISSLNPFY